MHTNTVRVNERTNRKVVDVDVSGRLDREDYEAFVPQIERFLRKHGKIRILFHMRGFQGWSAGALWKDVEFDLSHFNDIERLAIVGEKRWHRGMALFCKPFTTATVKYFDQDDVSAAREWLESP